MRFRKRDFHRPVFRTQTAGDLTTGASGGPVDLSVQTFFTGINDPFGNNPMGYPFNPGYFRPYTAWQNLKGKPAAIGLRESIARGESALFNTFPLTITGVPGLNDVTGKRASTEPAEPVTIHPISVANP